MPVTFPSHRVTFPSNGKSYSPVRGSHIPPIRESHIPQSRIFTFLDQVTFPSQGKSHSVAKERQSSEEVIFPSQGKSHSPVIGSHSQVRASHIPLSEKATLSSQEKSIPQPGQADPSLRSNNGLLVLKLTKTCPSRPNKIITYLTRLFN